MDTLPIGVVVLNYNRAHYTFQCLESLFSAAPSPCEIILIDNGSTDNSAREFTARFDNNERVTLLLLDENLGYCGGMNKGIKLLLGNRGIKIILLLNNDTTAKSDFLLPLMECLKDGSVYSLATPKILREDGLTIWSTGENVFYPLLLSVRSKGAKDGPRFNTPREINCITGCAMAVRREVFEKIGLFDEKYFSYVEDVDFCRRARWAGFRFAYCHKSVVYHKGARCLGEFSPEKIYLNVRNKAYFIKKNVSLLLWPISWLWLSVVVISWVFRALYRKEFNVIGGILQGLYDFARDKMGPLEPTRFQT